jgi:DNA-binding protein HU-beta
MPAGSRPFAAADPAGNALAPMPARSPATIAKNDGTLKPMTRQQLVEAVSEKTGQGRAAVDAVLDSILGTITEALSSNERVDLRGFGSFVVKEKKERQGRNPRTGETITIAAKRDAGFRPGKELSEKLTQSKPGLTAA